MLSTMIQSRVARALALLAVIAFGVPFTARADVSSPKPPICSTSFDPYKVSTAILRA